MGWLVAGPICQTVPGESCHLICPEGRGKPNAARQAVVLKMQRGAEFSSPALVKE